MNAKAKNDSMWEDIKSIKKDLCEGLESANSELRKAIKDFLEKARECLRAEKALRREVGVLLKKIRRKAEETESRLKEIKDRRTRECERNRKWRGPCKFLVSIPYWGWLSAIYAICLSAIISISVVYGIAIFLGLIAYVATAIIFLISYIFTAAILFVSYTLVVFIIWLGIWTFFFIHWAFRVTIVPVTIVLIPVFLWNLIILMYGLYGYITTKGLTEWLPEWQPEWLTEWQPKSLTDGIAIDMVALASFVPLLVNVISKLIPDNFNKLVKTLYEMIGEVIKNLKKLLLPPRITMGGIEETKCYINCILEDTKKAISTLFLIIFAAIFAAISASSAGQAVNKVTDTEIVHNDVRLDFRNTVPLVVKDDKEALFTTMLSFPCEAKAQDWVNGDYDSNEKSRKESNKKPSEESSEESNNACRDDRASYAVEPDDFYRRLLKPFLKGLSDCGDAERKVVLRTVGFASSSGVLSVGKAPSESKDDDDFRKKLAARLQAIETEAEAETETKTTEENAKEKSCFERAGGSDTDDESNGRILSNAFNLCMAELRASNVKKMLDEIINAHDDDAIDHIEVKAHKWDTYSQMCLQRGFADTKKEDDADTGKEGDAKCYDSELGMMNRRVEVWVMELPGCTNFFPNNRTPPKDTAEEASPESQGNTCDLREVPAQCKAGTAVDSCPNAGCQEVRGSKP